MSGGPRRVIKYTHSLIGSLSPYAKLTAGCRGRVAYRLSLPSSDKVRKQSKSFVVKVLGHCDAATVVSRLSEPAVLVVVLPRVWVEGRALLLRAGCSRDVPPVPTLSEGTSSFPAHQE